MSEASEAPVVDSHVHVFTQDMPLATHAWTRPSYSFTAEDLLATLDAHGVRFAVVAGISLFGYYNDYMIAKLKEHPRRLRGTVNVPATVELRELEAMKAAGVVGVRLFLSSQLAGGVADLRSAEYQRLLKYVRDLEWHVHFLAQEDVFADALDVLRAAGVKVVIDHFGNPEPKGPDCAKVAAALQAVDSGNVWLKISAGFRFSPRSPPRTAADYARARETEAEFDRYLLERVGPERLLWGSDCPFVGHEGAVAYRDTIDAFDAAIPDARTRRAISDGALAFYFS